MISLRNIFRFLGFFFFFFLVMNRFDCEFEYYLENYTIELCTIKFNVDGVKKEFEKSLML